MPTTTNAHKLTTVTSVLQHEFLATAILSDKVPLRDVPRGVAHERIEKHTACYIVSYPNDIILRCEISVL